MLTVQNDRLVHFEFDGQKCISLPEGIVGIGTKAFYGVKQLRGIVLSRDVVTIGDYAFAKCSGLEFIEMPMGLRRLGTGSFQGCVGLREVRLPDGVASIHACAFEGCSALESVRLPQSLRRNIESNTFAGCKSLRRVTIPSSIQQIKSGAFSGCIALEEVVFENRDVIIDEKAFMGCFALSPATRAFIDGHIYQADTIDINSSASGPVGRLSNYTERHFTLDGVECRSLEGALQSLKCPNQERQCEICRLVGGRASKAGRAFDWEWNQLLYWHGRTYPRQSDDYQRLISRIYDAAFEQDVSFREDLSAMKGKKISHRMGRTDPSQTILTRNEFIAQLERLMARVKDD